MLWNRDPGSIYLGAQPRLKTLSVFFIYVEEHERRVEKAYPLHNHHLWEVTWHPLTFHGASPGCKELLRKCGPGWVATSQSKLSTWEMRTHTLFTTSATVVIVIVINIPSLNHMWFMSFRLVSNNDKELSHISPCPLYMLKGFEAS